MLNFPIKKAPIKQVNQKNIKKANLGMLLEEMINETEQCLINEWYWWSRSEFCGLQLNQC